MVISCHNFGCLTYHDFMFSFLSSGSFWSYVGWLQKILRQYFPSTYYHFTARDPQISKLLLYLKLALRLWVYGINKVEEVADRAQMQSQTTMDICLGKMGTHFVKSNHFTFAHLMISITDWVISININRCWSDTARSNDNTYKLNLAGLCLTFAIW